MSSTLSKATDSTIGKAMDRARVRTRIGGPMVGMRVMAVGLMAMMVGVGANGQSTPSPAVDPQKPACSDQVRSTYLLGPEDQLQISGPELDEPVGKLVGVDGEGDIQAPMVGRVHAAGLTVQQAEK